MAIEDENIVLQAGVPQDILLDTSSSFIVQNISNIYCRYKVKDGNATVGGIAKPGVPYKFASDMTFESDQTATLYIIRD